MPSPTKLKIGLLILSIVVPASLLSQQSGSTASSGNVSFPWPLEPIVRDPDAIAVVQASIDAMGGSAAIGSVSTCVVNGTLDAGPGAVNPSGTMLWETAGLETKSVFTGPNGTLIESSGDGHPFRVIQGVSQPMKPHLLRATFYPSFAPITLLRELQDPNYSVRIEGTTTVGSDDVTIVRLASEASPMDSWVTPQNWYFSSTTKLPVEVDRRLPDPKYPAKFGLEVDTMSNYQSSSGILFPTNFAFSIGGNMVKSVSVTSIKLNSVIPPSEFDQNQGGAQ